MTAPKHGDASAMELIGQQLYAEGELKESGRNQYFAQLLHLNLLG